MSSKDNDFDDIVVEDPENYNYSEENHFSHESLIMLGIKKCMELGSVELIEGWDEDSTDDKGRTKRVHHPDTRKMFINAVKVLMAISYRDYDDNTKKVIDQYLELIRARKQFWQEQEYKWWLSLNPMQQRQLSAEGKQVIKGYFNKKLDFDNHFHEEEIDIYFKIFTEINNLTKVVRDYRAIALRN